VVADNKLFVAVLVPAFLLRVDAELGYRWWVYFNDSFNYVSTAATGVMDPARVSGYSVFLRALMPLHSFGLVVAVQHVMGLLVGVMIYALAKKRFGAPAWLAAGMAVPTLYDGFEIQLEHQILSDMLFLFVAMLAVAVLLWSPRISWWKCALAGLLIGVSAIVRSTGLPLIPVFAVYLLIAAVPAGRGRWRDWREWRPLVAGLAAFAVATAVPVLAYEALYDHQHGQFNMNTSTGVFLYSRVMTFADCSKMTLSSDPELLALCTTVPPAQRPIAQAYIWTPASPLDRFPPDKFSALPNSLAQKFAIKAIEAQPLDYAKAVFADTWRTFYWPRSAFPNAATYDEYLFGYRSLDIPPSPISGYPSTAAYYEHGTAETRVVNPYAGLMRVYQRYFWLPGTVYGLILLVGLVALIWRWRRGPVGPGAFLAWASSAVLIVIPAATAEFDYRYVTTASPFGCLALALAFGTFTRDGPSPSHGVPACAEPAATTGDADGEPATEESAPESPGVVEIGTVNGTAGGARGEAGRAAGLAGGVARGGLGGGNAKAGHDKRDLATDAT
jgi:hypothetical protein